MLKFLEPGQILILKDNTILIYKKSKDSFETCSFCYFTLNNINCSYLSNKMGTCQERGYFMETKAGL